MLYIYTCNYYIILLNLEVMTNFLTFVIIYLKFILEVTYESSQIWRKLFSIFPTIIQSTKYYQIRLH
ncbi:hypothetical protein LEQ41_02070 [Streptococcus agalactiae]|nr:hypothetical protein [Streptococcus agalactiae]